VHYAEQAQGGELKKVFPVPFRLDDILEKANYEFRKTGQRLPGVRGGWGSRSQRDMRKSFEVIEYPRSCDCGGSHVIECVW
jgi:hypothetical protein